MFPPIKPNVHRMLSAARGKYTFPWELPGEAADVFPGTRTYVQLPAIPEVPRIHYGRCPDAEGRNSACYNIQLPKLSEIYNPVRIRPSGQMEMECIKPAPPKTKAAKHPPQRSSKVRRSTSHCPEATRPSVPRQLPSLVPSLGDALNLLCNNDWEKKIEGINMVRSLSASHPSVVLESLHALIVGLTIEVKNLSSKVSRAAIGCLAAMLCTPGEEHGQRSGALRTCPPIQGGRLQLLHTGGGGQNATGRGGECDTNTSSHVPYKWRTKPFERCHQELCSQTHVSSGGETGTEARSMWARGHHCKSYPRNSTVCPG
ncbi:uncharacterized protein LOC135070480 [Pseudophryne corroboree]|uniref:uncharacterized protein LOC135070480 n=1 Tax=Pseudophryne corroboree TaxID=495146 RepID=UPI003081356A